MLFGKQSYTNVVQEIFCLTTVGLLSLPFLLKITLTPSNPPHRRPFANELKIDKFQLPCYTYFLS